MCTTHRKENEERTNRGVLLRNLGGLRRAKALTQRHLAECAGVSQGTVWRLENLRRGSYSVTVRKLAAALEVRPEVLVQEPDAEREQHVGEEESGLAGRREPGDVGKALSPRPRSDYRERPGPEKESDDTKR